MIITCINYKFLLILHIVDQIKKKKIVEAKNKGLPLPPKKKNIQPPSRLKRRTDNITVNEVIDDPENTSGI